MIAKAPTKVLVVATIAAAPTMPLGAMAPTMPLGAMAPTMRLGAMLAKPEGHFFAYQKSCTRKHEGEAFFCLPKIPDKKKNECEAFFSYQKFWTKKNEGGAYFCLMYQLVTKNYRRRKNEGATFFCLPKILDRNPGQKKVFFCLMSHLVAPKILDKKKGAVFFGLPEILDQKRMKVRR